MAMGRPKKPKHLLRRKQFQLLLTTEEHLKLQAVALSKHTEMARLLRDFIHSSYDRMVEETKQ